MSGEFLYSNRASQSKYEGIVQGGCDFTDDISLVTHVWAWATVTFTQTIHCVRQQPVCCDSGKLSSLFPFLEDVFKEERAARVFFMWGSWKKKKQFPLRVSRVHLWEALHRLPHLPLRKYSLGCGCHFLFGLQLPTFKCVLLYRIVFLGFV